MECHRRKALFPSLRAQEATCLLKQMKQSHNDKVFLVPDVQFVEVSVKCLHFLSHGTSQSLPPLTPSTHKLTQTHKPQHPGWIEVQRRELFNISAASEKQVKCCLICWLKTGQRVCLDFGFTVSPEPDQVFVNLVSLSQKSVVSRRRRDGGAARTHASRMIASTCVGGGGAESLCLLYGLPVWLSGP